jgi:SagB-type dehydrogenase family enzyme
MDARAGASGLIGDPDESRQASALFDYHERSKHRLDRYAPGPGGLDWANQPDPFRQFGGTDTVKLPFGGDRLTSRYNAIRRGELGDAHAFDLAGIGILLEISLGLSAWKAFGSTRWALRCNPSSGNLHPTESYLLCPSLPGLSAGVYHYVSRDHALERRAVIDGTSWDSAFGTNGVVVGLTSIYWREAWKYGMRAWRYCQHDCGHAIAALSYAAAALGWQTRVLSSVGDDTVAAVLGVDHDTDFRLAEKEAADTLLWIGVGASRADLDCIRDSLRGARWSGRANRLSAEHVDWPDIDSIHRATQKPPTVKSDARIVELLPPPADPPLDLPFATLARRRRSAVNFDGETHIGEECFYAMLDVLLPRENTPPWNALESSPSIHAALLVHRVRGLDAGLYMLLRDRSVLSDFRQTLRLEWLWEKKGPPHLPLYLLLPYELREIAKLICCHQDIAADSCFALGMLAPVERVADEPWRYRRQFWECGMLGQALYLEAEAAGIRSTGIGCFFDDEMHELLGITDLRWQSLYHFTTGGPIDDPRLSTLPPYQFQP